MGLLWLLLLVCFLFCSSISRREGKQTSGPMLPSWAEIHQSKDSNRDLKDCIPKEKSNSGVNYFSSSLAAPTPSQPRPLEGILRAKGHTELEAKTERIRFARVCPELRGLPGHKSFRAKTNRVLGKRGWVDHPQRGGMKNMGRNAIALISTVFLNSLKTCPGLKGRHLWGKCMHSPMD